MSSIAPQNSKILLPRGWVSSTIGEISTHAESVNPKEKPTIEFDYLDIASIDNKIQIITTPKRYLGKDAPSRARQVVLTGDILFSTVRTYLKNVANVDSLYNHQIASTGFCVIRPSPDVENKFVFYYIQTDRFLNPLNELQRGTNYPAVRDSDVFIQPIPLPPLPEQHRIVAKIEELLTQLEAGIASLKKAQAQLKRYRQAVLKAAFEGRLTMEWREEHKGEIEPVDSLFERYRKINTGSPKIYENPSRLHKKNVPLSIPQKWIWVNLGSITESMKNGIYKPRNFYCNDGIACLRMYNIDDGKIVWKDIKRMRIAKNPA